MLNCVVLVCVVPQDIKPLLDLSCAKVASMIKVSADRRRRMQT